MKRLYIVLVVLSMLAVSVYAQAEGGQIKYTKTASMIDKQKSGQKGQIIDVEEDPAVKLLIDSFPEETSSLMIVGECLKQFGSSYDKMSFSDWGNLVRSYLRSKGE